MHTEPELQVTNLLLLQQELLAKAQTAGSRRAAVTVYGGRESLLRQTALALLAGAELGDHDSPPEATLHVLAGRVVLRGAGREWTLESGDLLPIPPERHSVAAVEDSVFVLTVRRAADNAP